MRVLWFVHIPFPKVKEYLGQPLSGSGWWLTSLADELTKSKEVELGICHFSCRFTKYEKIIADGVVYYCCPLSRKNLLGFSRKTELEQAVAVVDDFGPDIVNVHGSEYFTGLISNRIKVPVLLTIQGVMGDILPYYFGDIGFSRTLMLQLRSLKDIKPVLITIYSYLYAHGRVRSEREIFNVNRYYSGRTEWDHQCQERLSPGGEYFVCHRILRSIFLKTEWNISGSRKYRIYCTSSPHVFKGVHTLIKAVSNLVTKYPQVTLHVAGQIENKGWGGHLRRLIKKYKLEQGIKFTGYLTDEQIRDQLLEANVYVCPSFIENSPNSLAEAMMTGVPCIASDVGGIPSMIDHSVNGLLCKCGDPEDIASKIESVFDNDDLCQEIGRNARATALNRHNPEKAGQDTLKSYTSIIGGAAE